MKVLSVKFFKRTKRYKNLYNMKFHDHTQENGNSIIQRQLDKVRAKMDTNQLQTQMEQHQKIDVCLFNGILLKIIHPRTEPKDWLGVS